MNRILTYRWWGYSLVFFACCIAATVTNHVWLLLLPFALLLLPAIGVCILHAPARLCWLLLAMLPLSAELQLTPSLGMDFPDEPLLWLLTALIIIQTCYAPRWFPQTLLKHPLPLLVLVQLAWTAVTCVYSTEPVLSVKFLLAKIWYIVPLLVLPQLVLTDKAAFRRLACCLLVPMLLVVVQTMIRHAFFGFSFDKLKYIFSPFFRNHVNYSAMLVCLLAVTWCAWRVTPAGRLRNWLLAGLSLGVIALYFAYSRGAWLALLAGIMAAFLIRKRWLMHAVAIALVMVAAAILYLASGKKFMEYRPVHDQTVFHSNFGEHMSATLKGKDISNAERLYRWVAGSRMVAEKPLTGFGPNAFYQHYRPYAVRDFETWVSNNPEHSSVHNYFLLLALEQGWPGVCLFLVLLVVMLACAQHLYHQLADVFWKNIALTTGCVLVMITIVNCMSDMIETDKIGGLFWLSMGVLIALSGIRTRQQTIA